MQFFGSPLTVNCDKSLTSRSIQRLPFVDKNGPLRPYQMVMELANDALTMEYCEEREGRRERKGKTVSFKRFAIEMSTFSKFQRDTIITYTGKFVEEMHMMIVITKR